MTDQNENEKEKDNDVPETPSDEAETTSEPRQSEQRRYEPEPEIYPSGIWMRALHMIIFMALFGVAEGILFFMAVFQFFWMLFTKSRNPSIAQFGSDFLIRKT